MTQPIHNPDPSAGKQATLLEAFTRFKNITTVLLTGLHGQERIAIMQEYCELVESIPEMIKRESAFADLASGRLSEANEYIDRQLEMQTRLSSGHLAGRSPAPQMAAVEPASTELIKATHRFIEFGKSGGDTSWHSDSAQDLFYQLMVTSNFPVIKVDAGHTAPFTNIEVRRESHA